METYLRLFSAQLDVTLHNGLETWLLVNQNYGIYVHKCLV